MVFSTRIFRNLDLGIEWKGYGARIIKVHCKSSRKSCSGKTKIRTIFFGDTVSQGTFEHINDLGLIRKFSRWGSFIRNN